jgi:hypothetical protein
MVTIDWTGITEHQLKLLAKQLLVHDLQAKIQKGDFENFPTEITIVAVEEVHEAKVCLQKFTVPESWKGGSDSSRARVEKLTPMEEITQMLLDGNFSEAEILAMLNN